MLGRLALLMVLGAVSACDAPPQATAPVPPPAPLEPAVVLSAQQIQERSAQCERKARETFQGDSGSGIASHFAHHYNTKLDTCFYLLTVTRQEILSKKLLDINENETYGEYSGLAAAAPPKDSFPATCRVVDLYCASGREWEVLVERFMHD